MTVPDMPWSFINAINTNLNLDFRMVLWSIVIGLACFITWSRSEASSLPTINAYPRDFFRRKARETYNTNAKALTASGFAKFNGPFRIITTQGSRVVLPSSYTDWAKNCKELDHQALVHDDFFADYPGFDGQAVITNPDRILIDVTRTKLAQNAKSIQTMNQQIKEVLADIWTDNQDWHHLNWPEATLSIISRMSASIFAGPELASDPEWQDLTMTYTVNVFNAVGALRQWPSLLRPLVARFLSQMRTCREQVKLARRKIEIVLKQRESEKDAARAESRSEKRYEDAITWVEEIAAGRPYDPAASQLALAIAALHTTTEAFRALLLDLCVHPELIEPMREEIKTCIANDGWTPAALANMHLVDSVMKESQRFKSAIVGIERKVIKPTTLPNGTPLPRGTIICIDASDMFNPSIHDNPDIFDGHRFQHMRAQPGKSSVAPFVSSTREHNTFGAGKFICPGRFFVASEIKIALAWVLSLYELRLKGGGKPRELMMGFYPFSDLEVEVEVRKRRDCDLDLDLDLDIGL